MARFDRSLFIYAPPRRVWELLTDFDQIPDWWVNIAWIRQSSPGPLVAGTTTESVVKGLGMREPTRGHFTIYEPPCHLELESHGQLGTRSWLECELDPEEDGTLLRIIIEFWLPGGGLGKLLGKVSEGHLRQDFDRSLRNLRLMLEAERRRRDAAPAP